MNKTIGVSFAALAIWAILLGAGFAEGELPMAELEVDHALTFDFATPHTDWARPYALGRMRVLFFTAGMGTAPRECVELMERFDIEGKAVFWTRIVDTDRSHWHGGDVGQRRMVALLREKWDRMMRLGEFDAAKYKLLILSRAEAIGDQEAQVIRNFVEQGGTVLADVRPGIYDDHCKPRAQGVLDDLFGIARTGRAAHKPAKLATAEKAPVPIELDKVQVDPAVKVVGPKAVNLAVADGVPAMIVNPVGKGRAVLLNFPGASYPKLSTSDTPEAAADFFKSLLSQAGLTAAVTATDQTGTRVENLETIRWHSGTCQIVSLFRPKGKDQEATVELKGLGPRFVYDLRRRKALGQPTKVPITIRPARPTFLVLAAQAAPAPKLVLDKPSVQRGTVVRATISVPDAEGLHALRIRARAGDRRLEWLDQNIIVGRRPKTFEIPVAYNDPAGEYEIVAIDLFTDRPAKVILTVR